MIDQGTLNEKKDPRINFRLFVTVILHPKAAFRHIKEQPFRSWLTPLLLVSIMAVANLLAAGWIKQQSFLNNGTNLPSDIGYYTPEQQAQFTQATQATQGVVFVYILPILGSLLGIWLGWLLVGGLLHFSTTLFGGRGDTLTSMNVVAWSGSPIVIRYVIRLVYMLITRKLIISPGLSGFVPTSDNGWISYLGILISFIDLYLIWTVVLMLIGVKTTSGLSLGKTISCVLIVILIILFGQSGAKYLISKLSGLSITRPFFF